MTDPAAKPSSSKTLRPKLNPSPGKLGAEKLTPDEQRRRFIEGAREAGCSEDEEEFRSALRKIVKPKAS